MVPMPCVTTVAAVTRMPSVTGVGRVIGVIAALMLLVAGVLCHNSVMTVVAGMLVGVRVGGAHVVVGLLVVHARSIPPSPARMLPLDQDAGRISLSTTHLWLVMVMPSAS